MTALAIAIFIIVAIIGLALAFLGWRKWRVVDPLNTAPRTPIILIIGLVMLAVGTVGVGVIFLKQGVFNPGGEWPEAQAPKPFSIIATSPADGATAPRNSVVFILFNRHVKSTDIFINVTAKGENDESHPIPGSAFVIDEPSGGRGEVKSTIVFSPLFPCSEDRAEGNCFEESKVYTVSLRGEKIHTADESETLKCSEHPCEFSFTADKEIFSNKIKVFYGEDLNLPASVDAPMRMTVENGEGIVFTRITLDYSQSNPRYLGTVIGYPSEEHPLSVDLSGVLVPSAHFISAEIYDKAGGRTLNQGIAGIFANHCFNKEMDENEISEDCGGPDCSACK